MKIKNEDNFIKTDKKLNLILYTIVIVLLESMSTDPFSNLIIWIISVLIGAGFLYSLLLLIDIIVEKINKKGEKNE